MTSDRSRRSAVDAQTLLRWLRKEGPATTRDIHQQLGVPQSTLSTRMADLFARGAVVRARSLAGNPLAYVYAASDTVSTDGLRQWEHVDDEQDNDDTKSRRHLPSATRD